MNGNGGSIDMSNGNFFWSKPTTVSHENSNRTGASPALCGADIHVRAGEVACLVGNVGSGKSALVKAMLGELYYFLHCKSPLFVMPNISLL